MLAQQSDRFFVCALRQTHPSCLMKTLLVVRSTESLYFPCKCSPCTILKSAWIRNMHQCVKVNRWIFIYLRKPADDRCLDHLCITPPSFLKHQNRHFTLLDVVSDAPRCATYGGNSNKSLTLYRKKLHRTGMHVKAFCFHRTCSIRVLHLACACLYFGWCFPFGRWGFSTVFIAPRYPTKHLLHFIHEVFTTA